MRGAGGSALTMSEVKVRPDDEKRLRSCIGGGKRKIRKEFDGFKHQEWAGLFHPPRVWLENFVIIFPGPG